MGSVIYWFRCSVSSNGGELVFSRCFWNYSQLNSFIETLRFPDAALGIARVKRCLVLRLKFKCDRGIFLSLVLCSKEEIVTQHAVVKNFLLNSEATEPEKLRDRGRISHKKACLSRTNVCCWLWGIGGLSLLKI